MLFTIQGLNAISKIVASKLTNVVPDIATFILDDFEKLENMMNENQDDSDFKNLVSELFEHYLSILDNLVKGSPKEVDKFIDSIIDNAANLLDFDPD
jgi:hypothetical protein